VDCPAHDRPGNPQQTDFWADHDIKAGQELPSSPTPSTPSEWRQRQITRPSKAWGPQSARIKTEAELIFTALAELSTRQIAETKDAIACLKKTPRQPTRRGGIARQARKH
jgi:hypothetical protein